MSEKATPQVPHPQVLRAAEDYAAFHKNSSQRMEDLRQTDEENGALDQQLETAKAELEKRSLLGRVVGRSAVRKLELHVDNAFSKQYEEFHTAPAGHMANISLNRDHYQAHEGEYHDNAVVLAEAGGVHINVQQTQEPAQPIAVRVPEHR